VGGYTSFDYRKGTRTETSQHDVKTNLFDDGGVAGGASCDKYGSI
jgi:hypothetical protein